MTSFQLKESPDGVSYLVCDPLTKAGFPHAFSTRSSGDLRVVDENRGRFSTAVGLKRPIVTCHQTHSTAFHFVPDDFDLTAAEKDGDALATKRSDVLVGVKTADCVPILIGDPSSGVAAAIHAGWRGTLARMAEKTVLALKAEHGFNPKKAVAAIGPSACVDCYEVGPELLQAFIDEFPYAIDLLQKNHLDVPLANVRQLIEAGVHPSNIYVSQYCTMRDSKLFFSHRRAGTERMLAVIGKS